MGVEIPDDQDSFDSGGARPRQSDVARLAGVSPSTVSKVINGAAGISAELRDRVTRVMQELGYDPGERRAPTGSGAGTRVRRVKLITFYQFLVRENSYFHAEVIRSVLTECERQGMEIETVLLSRDGPNDLDAYAAKLTATPADAMMLVGIDAPEILAPVRAAGVPALIVNGADPDCRIDCVSPALRDGSRMATRHLIEQGHREIVHVTHLYRRFIRQRLEGFRDALEEAGIAFSPERHVLDIDHDRHFSSERAADFICERVLSGQLNATAIFCVSDYTAFGVVQGIQRAGKSVPGDYSVACFDDLPLAQLSSPTLTSAGVDRDALGRLAVQRLVERMQRPDIPVLRIEMAPHLSVRNSTRRLEPHHASGGLLSAAVQ